MAERIWDKFLTERDKEVFASGGFGATAGFGDKPALIVIDVSYNFCGDRREPILESIKRFHNSCGEDAWDALPHIRKLIDKCHDKGVPVIYTTGEFRDDGWDAGGWAWKNSRTEEDTAPPSGFNRDGNDIMDEIAPGPKDIVIRKLKPSAFNGTSLMGFLNDLGADSLIVTGTTTSGCVRATVVDSLSHGYRTIVPEECVADKHEIPHFANLCDMVLKYADVEPFEVVRDYLSNYQPLND